jgi:hypothetical protein
VKAYDSVEALKADLRYFSVSAYIFLLQMHLGLDIVVAESALQTLTNRVLL